MKLYLIFITSCFLFKMGFSQCFTLYIHNNKYKKSVKYLFKEIDSYNHDSKYYFLTIFHEIEQIKKRSIIRSAHKWEKEIFIKDPISGKKKTYHAGQTPQSFKSITTMKSYNEIRNILQGYIAYIDGYLMGLESFNRDTAYLAFKYICILERYAELRKLK